MTYRQPVAKAAAEDIKKVARGTGITLVGSIGGRVLWFLCQVVIARFFGVELFGMYVLGLIVAKVADLIARFGLHDGAMRFVSIYRKSDDARLKGTFISAVFISFINGMTIGGLVYFLAEFISSYIFHKPELTHVIRMFSLCIPFMTCMTVIARASQGFHTTKYRVYIMEITQPITNIAFVSIFIFLGFGFSWIIFAYAISHIIAIIVGFKLIIGKSRGLIHRPLRPIYENKKLLTYSAPLLLSGFLFFLIRWTDNIMLGIMQTSSDVGIYRAAAQIPIFLLLVLRASNSIYGPIVAEKHHKGQIQEMEDIFKITTRWVSLITLPFALILIFSSKEVMAIFGQQFVGAGALVLVVLTSAQLVNCMTGGASVTLNMAGRQNIEFLNSLALVFINIMINLYLIPAYGCVGAALATAISIVIINVLRLVEIYLFFKVHPYSIGFIKALLAGMAALLALVFIDKYMVDHSLIIRVCSNSLIVFVTFILTFITTGIHNEDKLIFHSLVKRLNLRF